LILFDFIRFSLKLPDFIRFSLNLPDFIRFYSIFFEITRFYSFFFEITRFYLIFRLNNEDNQRKEQLNHFLQQIETNIEENIIKAPDCSDQLKGFLELRAHFTKDHEKPYSSLKFSSQIAVSTNNEQIIVNSPDFSPEKGQNEGKSNKFNSFNQDLLSEKERRKFFVIQQKMLLLLRKFTNKHHSQVRQKSQETNKKIEENTDKVFVITRFDEKMRNSNEGSIAALSSFERNYGRYYSSLKKLKKNDKPEFEGILQRMKGIKGRFNLHKYIKEI